MVELNRILCKNLRGECTLKVKLTNMQYIPTHTLICEELLFLDEILNLKKDVVIALANKFSIRISGYNVYYYDEKIIPTFDKFLKEKISYKEMHSLNTNF